MGSLYDQIKEILHRNGAYFARNGRGDHEIWKCGNKQATVDRNGKSRHTMNNALKLLGIKEKIK